MHRKEEISIPDGLKTNKLPDISQQCHIFVTNCNNYYSLLISACVILLSQWNCKVILLHFFAILLQCIERQPYEQEKKRFMIDLEGEFY